MMREEMPPEPTEKDVIIGFSERKSDQEAGKKIKEKIDIDSLRERVKDDKYKQVIPDLARLVIEVEDEIPNYDTILSDDAGGRLPSLFLRRIINRKREELGREPSNTYFIGWGRHANRKRDWEVRKFIWSKRKQIGKALLVTEHIRTGGSLNELAKLLEETEINFDIATVSTEQLPTDESMKDKKAIIKRLKYGSVGKAGEKAFHEGRHWPVPSGVTSKEGHFDWNAHPQVFNYREDLKADFLQAEPLFHKDKRRKKRYEEAVQKVAEQIKQARSDTDVMADELYKLLD
jgi:hypoxanthine phosphoribosyltransferase